jgi:hypothetical protein
MPFVQPSLLNILFNVPEDRRKNGRLFRKILRNSEPCLTKRALVKGGTTYPFALGPVEAWIWTKAKSKMGPVYHSRARRDALQALRSFALDALHSKQVASSGLYEMASLTRTVTAYYNGEEVLAGQVDWWLTFELWRRGISGKS